MTRVWILLALASCSAAPSHPPNPPALEFVLSVGKTTFVLGETVPVTCSLVNRGPRPVTIIVKGLHLPGSHESMTHWTWTQGDHQFGEYDQCSCRGHSAVLKAHFTILEPGQAHVFAQPHVYEPDLMKPGRIRLKGEYHSGKIEDVDPRFLPTPEIQALWRDAVAVDLSAHLDIEVVGKK